MHLLIRVPQLLRIKFMFGFLDLLLILLGDLFAALGHHALTEDSHVVRLLNILGLEDVCERWCIEICI